MGANDFLLKPGTKDQIQWIGEHKEGHTVDRTGNVHFKNDSGNPMRLHIDTPKKCYRLQKPSVDGRGKKCWKNVAKGKLV